MENMQSTSSPVSLGNNLIEWTIPEYHEHQRSDRWFIVFGLIAGGLLIYAITTLNFLFAVIILLTVFIIFMHTAVKPMQLRFGIHERGIIVGDRVYPYKELETFWIAYNPPQISTVYFRRKNTIKSILSIPLRDQNPLTIRETLEVRLEEDLNNEDETLNDFLGRSLKL